MLLDPDHWETPHEFNPHHFLDSDGKFVKKEAFVPYSLGTKTNVSSLSQMSMLKKLPDPGTEKWLNLETESPKGSLQWA